MIDTLPHRAGASSGAIIQTRPRRRRLTLAALALMLSLPAICQGDDDAIRDALIQHSIATYQGNCPCPYNLDRAGRRCGKRSAYSRPGGEKPLCYRADVTQRMIERFKARGS